MFPAGNSMTMEQRLTGSHTAKRYALWRSRQAVLNALISDAGDSVYRPDDATADAIASLGEVLLSPMQHISELH